MPSPVISVLTPSIESRAVMLQECIESVQAQTYREVEHLVHVDYDRAGCSWVMNHLAERAGGEWLVPLADDDLLLPGALSYLLSRSAEADVVYSPPLVWGNADTHFFGEPPRIPSFGLIRTTLWRELGGYDLGRIREEDRDLWQRAMANGARFVRADSWPTWVYRFHGGNKSYHGGVAS